MGHIKHPWHCNRTDERYAARPGLEPGTLRLQGDHTLQTELPDCLHIIHPVPVHTQVTRATLLPPYLLRFGVEGVESHSFQRRICSVTAVTAPNCNRTEEKHATRPGLEPGTLRLQGERSPN